MPAKVFSKLKEPEISGILILVVLIFYILVVIGEKISKNRNRSSKLEVAEKLRTEGKIEEAEKIEQIEKIYAESPEK